MVGRLVQDSGFRLIVRLAQPVFADDAENWVASSSFIRVAGVSVLQPVDARSHCFRRIKLVRRLLAAQESLAIAVAVTRLLIGEDSLCYFEQHFGIARASAALADVNVVGIGRLIDVLDTVFVSLVV